MEDKRHQFWSLTFNNPEPADDVEIDNARRKGWVIVGQKEQGKEGTIHYQCHLNTKSTQRFAAVKKAFARAHIEVARNPEALKQYVQKEDTRVGDMPSANRPMTMAQVMELLANHSPGGLIYAALTNDELDQAFWSATRSILESRPGMISLLVQPNYMRAYRHTICVWIEHAQVNCEQSLLLDDEQASTLVQALDWSEFEDEIHIPWEELSQSECPYALYQTKHIEDCTCGQCGL